MGPVRRPGAPDDPAPVREEVARLGPDTYPTRAFYGHYLDWVFGRVLLARARRRAVTVHRGTGGRRSRTSPDGRQTVRLGDGTLLDA